MAGQRRQSSNEGRVLKRFLASYHGGLRRLQKGRWLKIYVDGKSAPLETKTDKLSANIITNTVPLILGKRYKSLPLTGRIDDVRFYSRALAEKEITVLARNRTLRWPVYPDKRTEAQKTELKHFFRENYAADLSKAEQELAALKQKA